MTRLFVDATTLIALGTVGELDLLKSFDGTAVVLPQVRTEVTTEPARTNLARVINREVIATDTTDDIPITQAQTVLGESTVNGDVELIAAVLGATAADRGVGVVSDDQRVRTTARGLGAHVTGTVGVVVRAVEEGLSGDDAKALLARLDTHGLHMTGELRSRASTLIDDAAARSSE